MPRTVNEADGSQELCWALTVRACLAGRIVRGRLAGGTFVERSVGVADSDCDSSTEFFRVPSGPDPTQGLDNGALAIVDMPEGSNVDLRLDL
jgi:hypothetical protein